MNYRQPILIFGIAIPLLIMAAIGGAIFYAYKSINDKATVKEKGIETRNPTEKHAPGRIQRNTRSRRSLE